MRVESGTALTTELGICGGDDDNGGGGGGASCWATVLDSVVVDMDRRINSRAVSLAAAASAASFADRGSPGIGVSPVAAAAAPVEPDRRAARSRILKALCSLLVVEGPVGDGRLFVDVSSDMPVAAPPLPPLLGSLPLACADEGTEAPSTPAVEGDLSFRNRRNRSIFCAWEDVADNVPPAPSAAATPDLSRVSVEAFFSARNAVGFAMLRFFKASRCEGVSFSMEYGRVS